MTIFDPAALEKVVQRHLADVPIPEDKRGAFITVGNQDGVKAAIAVRVGDTWSVGAFLDVEKRPGDDWDAEYGVLVRAVF